MAKHSKVIIVGAGPAGILLGLLLAKSGIDSFIIEKERGPTDDTRAVFYQAVSHYEFNRAGIYDEVLQEGLLTRSAAFYDIHGKKLFGLPGQGAIALRLDKLTAIARRHLGEGHILYNHSAVDVGQSIEKAWIDVKTPSGVQRFEADYVIGCDGGQSAVRRSMLGREAMPGFTWDKALLALGITCELPSMEDSNLFIDKEESFILFRPTKLPSHWRLILSGVKEDEASTAVERLLSIKAADFSIDRARPYQIHQRCVETMRKGRLVLASDAAHLCCPYGALGLNGGIADIGSLADCLEAIFAGRADDSILDIYSDVRVGKWMSMIDPQSQGMCRMLSSDPQEVIAHHPIYKMSMALANNPAEAMKRAPDPLALRYDFTPHFKSLTADQAA